jgi:hypothetical protein
MLQRKQTSPSTWGAPRSQHERGNDEPDCPIHREAALIECPDRRWVGFDSGVKGGTGLEPVSDQLHGYHDQAHPEEQCGNPLEVLSRLSDQVAEPGHEDQEADHDQRVGNCRTNEDEGVGSSDQIAVLGGVLQPSRWTDPYEVEGQGDQEDDEASHPKPTRPPTHISIE